MSLSSRINHLGIRERVLILALVPMLMITFALSGYMITSRLNSERENLFINGETLLSFLASGAEFGMFSDNETALATIAKAPFERPEVSDVIFINTHGEIVYQTAATKLDPSHFAVDNSILSSPPPLSLAGQWLLKAPVLLSTNSIDDFPGDGPEMIESKPEVLGWVLLLINEKQLIEQQTQIILRGILITLIGLSLTVWLALTIGRSITKPIQGIIETIDRLRNEDLDARITVENRGEIGELEQGINSLASRVQRTRIRLQDQIDEATKNLRVTLDRLEKKNIDLVNAKRRAEQANLAKDQFLARMSHELRTPLTSVMGFIKLLQKTTLNHEQKEYSQIVSRTSTLLLSLIDDILDFSKLQSDAIQIEKIPFNLEQIIEDTLAMQAAAANEKGLGLYFVSDPRIPLRVMGDPTRLKQVVSNLIGNAVKFTASGHVVTRATCISLTENQVSLRIQVTDTGIGIDQEKQASLFQPFSQADTSITRRFGGSGLGLVITKHLVELMGGTISLDSLENKGTEAVVEVSLEHKEVLNSNSEANGQNILVYAKQAEAREELLSCVSRRLSLSSGTRTQHQLLNHLKSSSSIDTLILDLPKNTPHQYYQQQLLRSIRRHFQGKIILIVPRSSAISDNSDLSLSPFEPIVCLPRPISRHRLLEALEPEHDGADNRTDVTPNTSNQCLRGLDLLVAEDNDFNRLLLRKILEQAGANPVLVSNGEQALAQASQKRFACVLMDVHMPLMDGIEASRQIRLLPPPLNDTPILALTANVIANEEHALKQTGVETTLFKPINEKLMFAEIQRAAQIAVTDTDIEEKTEKPRLTDYGISNQALHIELQGQINSIQAAYIELDITAMRDHSHQLMGLAGLLDLVELEAATEAFNHAVKTKTWKGIWPYLWRLKRVITSVEV